MLRGCLCWRIQLLLRRTDGWMDRCILPVLRHGRMLIFEQHGMKWTAHNVGSDAGRGIYSDGMAADFDVPAALD